MQFEEKLDIALTTIKDIYHLDDLFITTLKDNLETRAKYYHSIIPDFKNEIIYLKECSSIGDFFLNRLLHTIRTFEYNYVFNSNNSDNKEFNNETQTLKLSIKKSLNDITFSKLKNRMTDLNDDIVLKVNKKIQSHEIGHALQTNYSGTIGYNDTKHNLLINTLVDHYPNIFIKPSDNNELTLIQNGLIPLVKDDNYKAMRTYYSKKENIKLLDDILNEDEALRINNINEIQNKYVFGNDCYKNIYNFDSINYKITSYAREMKIVLGLNNTFHAMYIDSIKFYDFFDSYKTIATMVLKNNKPSKIPVITCILDSLEKVKDNSLYDALKLDLFFSKCLENKIKYLLKHNINENELLILKKNVDEFRKLTVKCDIARLNHDDVLDNIDKLLKNYKR